jgi:hypothetical protein
MTKLANYFWVLLEQSPSLIAMLACLVFALTRWKRYPKVAMVVAVGLALLLVHAIVFIFVYDLVPPIFLKSTYQNTEESERISRIVYVVLGLIYNTTAAVGFGILLAGVFIQRKPANQSNLAT